MRSLVSVSDEEADFKKQSIQVPMITLENRIIDYGIVMNEVIQSVSAIQPKNIHFSKKSIAPDSIISIHNTSKI